MADDLAALVAELRRLRAAATPGDWSLDPSTAHFHVIDGDTGTVAHGVWANDGAYLLAVHRALPTLLAALETAQRERDEARGVVNTRWPDTAELDEKLADHDAWVRRQRMMRVAIAPVNVEAVGDLLREMRTMFAAGTEDNAIREARIAELEREVAALRECEDKGAAHD